MGLLFVGVEVKGRFEGGCLEREVGEVGMMGRNGRWGEASGIGGWEGWGVGSGWWWEVSCRG